MVLTEVEQEQEQDQEQEQGQEQVWRSMNQKKNLTVP